MEEYNYTIKWQLRGSSKIHQSPYGYTKKRAEYLVKQGNDNFGDPYLFSKAHHWAEVIDNINYKPIRNRLYKHKEYIGD